MKRAASTVIGRDVKLFGTFISAEQNVGVQLAVAAVNAAPFNMDRITNVLFKKSEKDYVSAMLSQARADQVTELLHAFHGSYYKKTRMSDKLAINNTVASWRSDADKAGLDLKSLAKRLLKAIDYINGMLITDITKAKSAVYHKIMKQRKAEAIVASEKAKIISDEQSNVVAPAFLAYRKALFKFNVTEHMRENGMSWDSFDQLRDAPRENLRHDNPAKNEAVTEYNEFVENEFENGFVELKKLLI
jgi:hypothetical protein